MPRNIQAPRNIATSYYKCVEAQRIYAADRVSANVCIETPKVKMDIS
jgi:hypothetical protein